MPHKTSLILLFIILQLHSFSQANQITITDNDLTEGTYRWTSDNIYLLDGLVYLEGGSLTIEPGTIIKAKRNPTSQDEASALIITKNAQILAKGEYMNPIIFTSEFDDLSNPTDLAHQQNGLWGGIVLCGNGILPSAQNQPTSATLDFLNNDERSRHGGTDISDNRGELSYVSIRYAGASNNGIPFPSLTLAALGDMVSPQEFDPYDFSFELLNIHLQYIDVHASAGDGISIIGGSPQMKNLSVSYCNGHSFDIHKGYIGKGQFWFAIDDENKAGYLLNVDGPHTDPTIFNLTLVGSGHESSNNKGIIFQNNSKGTIGMSAIGELSAGSIRIEDNQGDDSWRNFMNNEISLVSNYWVELSDESVFNDLLFLNSTEGPERAELFHQKLTDNKNETRDKVFNSISYTKNELLDPELSMEGFIDFDSYPFDDFFLLSYGIPCEGRGAFMEVGAWWLRYWTALDQENYLRHPCYESLYEALRKENLDPFFSEV